MKVNFKHAYKSISALPIEDLPEFAVITGLNGCGKTHFLQGIHGGAFSVTDRPLVAYFDFSIAPKSSVGDGRAGFVNVKEEWKTLQQHQGAALRRLRTVLDGLIEVTDNSLERIYSEATSPTPSLTFGDKKQAVISLIECLQENTAPPFLSETLSFARRMQSQFSKPPLLIDEAYFYDHYPLPLPTDEPFSGRIAKLFASYAYCKEQHLYRQFKLQGNTRSAAHPLENEFEHVYGPPPWDVLNKVFAAAGLEYKLNPPAEDGTHYEPRLLVRDGGSSIKFEDLSTGERVMCSFVFALYGLQDERYATPVPELILLDEVDAPLHPHNIERLMRVLQEVFVREYKKAIILTTHSVATVALAPKGAVHFMKSGFIRQVDNDEALRGLTVGVPFLSVQVEHRRQVFVESDYDQYIYEHLAELAQKQLKGQISLEFISAGHEKDGGCASVRNVVNSLAAAGNTSVFGIVDWDGKNNPNHRIVVLGHGKRFAIEHYIFDPLLIAAAVNYEDRKWRTLVGFNPEEPYTALQNFSSSRLQNIADTVLDRLEIARDGELVECKYLNDTCVKLPRAFLDLRAHTELEPRIRKHFDMLGRHKRNKLQRHVVDLLRDVPGLISMDLVSALQAVQN